MCRLIAEVKNVLINTKLPVNKHFIIDYPRKINKLKNNGIIAYNRQKINCLLSA